MVNNWFPLICIMGVGGAMKINGNRDFLVTNIFLSNVIWVLQKKESHVGFGTKGE